MATLSNISRRIFLNAFLSRSVRVSHRFVSTSTRKEESNKDCALEQSTYKKIPDFSKPSESEYWVGYGLDTEDEFEDTFRAHFTVFCFFTVLLCGCGFLYYYLPDGKRLDWARREAFIRLHEREQLGLDLVDPNYIDPSKIVLPPDEELSDEDIVI